ncbi:LOW QUALITY PROTEIN: DUF4283 domain-containing protein/zf-CCHC_4 domain-containing protein, partial [Cephalotus follicularis]
WRKTLIIKLLGKSIGIKLMIDIVRRLWQPAGDFELLEQGHGYLLAKFDNANDCGALTGGPWLICGHCLLVHQPWKLYFKPSSIDLSSITLWIHLPELSLEFYDESLLFAIRGLIRKPLHLDKFTTIATRTKYARLCVEVDLSKPLVLKVEVGRVTQFLEYKGIHQICFQCGIVGHKLGACSVNG